MLPALPGAPSPLMPQDRDWDLLLTAETHNFPCAVAPYPGSTGFVCEGWGGIYLGVYLCLMGGFRGFLDTRIRCSSRGALAIAPWWGRITACVSGLPDSHVKVALEVWPTAEPVSCDVGYDPYSHAHYY